MDRLTVLAMFSWQYLLMAFLACLGVVQMAAARSGRRHLWLVRRRNHTAVLGAILLVGGMAIFYLIPLLMVGPWGPAETVGGSATWARATVDTLAGARNINDTAGGLSGHWQALWFVVAWIGAVLVARTIGRRHQPTEEPSDRDHRVLVGASFGARP